MKRSIAILLLGCFAISFPGSFLLLQQRKYAIKSEVKKKIIEGIDRDELVLLIFTPKQSKSLDWEHEKEFGYKGKMYDIVYTDEVKGKIYYWCWLDDDETELESKLKKLLATRVDNDTQGKERAGRIISFLKTLYPLDTEMNFFAHHAWFRLIDTPCGNLYHSLHNVPPVPPPEMA